jgi:hypothetical protein
MWQREEKQFGARVCALNSQLLLCVERRQQHMQVVLKWNAYIKSTAASAMAQTHASSL